MASQRTPMADLGVPEGPYRVARRRRACPSSPTDRPSEALAYRLRRRRRRACWQVAWVWFLVGWWLTGGWLVDSGSWLAVGWRRAGGWLVNVGWRAAGWPAGFLVSRFWLWLWLRRCLWLCLWPRLLRLELSVSPYRRRASCQPACPRKCRIASRVAVAPLI